MDITYKKINNTQLFENFKNKDLLNMESCQNYIPLYVLRHDIETISLHHLNVK